MYDTDIVKGIQSMLQCIPGTNARKNLSMVISPTIVESYKHLDIINMFLVKYLMDNTKSMKSVSTLPARNIS